jgi:excisionase family DNA binding protein
LGDRHRHLARLDPGVSELYTIDEVAERLRVSRRTVQRLVADGRIRPVYVGRKPLVTARELEAYVASLVGRRLA